jgi:capsular polysaccharide biosynthesis protein
MADARLFPLELPQLTRARMDFALPFKATAKPDLKPLPYPSPEVFEAPPPVTRGYDSYSRWTTSRRQKLHHVVEVDNGFANCIGDVYDACGRRLALASHKSKANPGAFGLERNTWKSIGAKTTVKYDGDLFVVTSSTSKLYYHGLLEIVPRLHIAQKMGMGAKIPVYVDASKPFMQECLRALKVDNIVDASQHPRIQAAKLIVPCYEINSLDSIPERSTALLNELFPEVNASSAVPNRKIYLSRRQAGRRNIVNEHEVSAFLQAKGFETVFPENHSIQEQAELFRRATLVAGPSGGAFTNIVFCKEGTTILNFFHWQADNCFQKLCAASGLNYSYVASNSTISERIYRNVGSLKIGNRDFDIGIRDLQKTLDIIT